MSYAELVPIVRRTPDGRPVKLAVVIPALNEEATIGSVVASVPRQIVGVDEVEVIVVDDGSGDQTQARARLAGADRIAAHPQNRGLTATFNRGIETALASGADIVVHMDGDGQHDGREIPRLIAPLLTSQADIVVGVRPLRAGGEGSRTRRLGNRAGSWLFSRLLALPLSDFTSGFRAFSRDALLRLHVTSDYTYTLETLIQAARKRLAVAEVPIAVRPRAVGESRMTSSLPRYIGRTAGQAFRCLLHTNPLALFGRAAALMMLLSLAFTSWFVFGYRDGGMHLPALLAALLASILSVGLVVSGLVADGINSNRRLLEEALYRLKSFEGRDATAGHEAPPIDVPALGGRLRKTA
jgi:glycosyltransferase involved in cell wall biosynthesis